MKNLFGKTIDILAGVLEYRAARHKVIASNIANLDTPGYRPADIGFPAELKAAAAGGQVALMRTDAGHLPANAAGGEGGQIEETGEKVSLDGEMVNLAENHLMYNFSVELLARKFRSLNTVLKETR